MSPTASASASNLLHDLDIESTLQCPVCYEIPPKTIYMCKVGHHMCERCRWRLTTCPTCKSAITGCRNFLGESLTNKFSVLIKGNGEEGGGNNNLDDAINILVNNTLSRQSLEENDTPLKQLPNPPGVYKCLLESCRSRSGMGAGHMISHVENNHAHIFDKFQNKTATFKHKFENFCFRKRASKFHRAFSVTNMGLFFLNLESVQGDYINCWISTPAQHKRCESLRCELVFSKEDSSKTLSFISKGKQLLSMSAASIENNVSRPRPGKSAGEFSSLRREEQLEIFRPRRPDGIVVIVSRNSYANGIVVIVASNLHEKTRVFETGRVFVVKPEDHEMNDGAFFSMNVKIVYKAIEPERATS